MQNSTKIFSILWSFVFSLKFQNRVVLLQVLWPEKYPCFITSWTEVKWSEVKWRHSIMSDSLWPMDCSLPGYSVHGMFQAIVLERIAISFSRGSSRPRDRTRVSLIVDRRFTVWATTIIHDQKWNLHQYSTINSTADLNWISPVFICTLFVGEGSA